MTVKQRLVKFIERITGEFCRLNQELEELRLEDDRIYTMYLSRSNRIALSRAEGHIDRFRCNEAYAAELKRYQAAGVTFDPDEQILARQFRGWLQFFARNSGGDDWRLSSLPAQIASRNEFARAHGFENFYAMQVRYKDDLFDWQVFDLLDALVKKAGTSLRWDGSAGKKISEVLEPYVRQEDVLSIWGRTLAGLGIGFRGAHVQMNPFKRWAKSPLLIVRALELPREVSEDVRIPAKIVFECGAGGGASTLVELIAGSAQTAHIANFNAGIPWCTSWAPMNDGVRQWQVLLLNSVLFNRAWQQMYLHTSAGDNMSRTDSALLLARGEQAQRNNLVKHLAWAYAERAIYEEPQRLRERAWINELWRLSSERFGLPTDPLLESEFISMLADREKSATSHSLVLAHMATATTLRYLHANKLDGFANFGELMAQACWWKGGIASISSLLLSVTKEHLDVDDLVQHLCTGSRPEFRVEPVALEDVVLGGVISLGATKSKILATADCSRPGAFAEIEALWRSNCRLI